MVTLYCRSIFIKSVVDHTQVVQDVSLTEAISTLSMDNQSLFSDGGRLAERLR
jgi:hypothetical protein